MRPAGHARAVSRLDTRARSREVSARDVHLEPDPDQDYRYTQ